MARTASMTIAEAEAAIGRRGDVTVTSENRGLVRKWFVAQGLPALFVGGLSMRELAFATTTLAAFFSRKATDPAAAAQLRTPQAATMQRC